MLNKSEIRPNRKQYGKPRLEALGDLRTLTLGPSIGISDSGGRSALGSGFLPKPGMPNPDGSPPWPGKTPKP